MVKLIFFTVLCSVWAYEALAEPIKIIEATYGILKSPVASERCDATAAVSKECDGLEICSLRVGPDLCQGIDPAPGKTKEILVQYKCAEKRGYSTEAMDEEMAEPDCE